MSSELFENLGDDFRNLYEVMKRKVESRLPMLSGEEQKSLIREVERSNGDALALLRSMEAEIQKAPPYERVAMRNKLSSCKRQLDSVMKRIQHAARDLNDIDDMESIQRAQLFQGIQSLERTSESIQRSRQVADETEQVGESILEDLDRQGETLERTRDTLEDTKSALGKTGSILRGMAIRVITSKLIMLIVIVAEMGILAGVIYWKYFSNNNKKPKPT